MFFVFLRFQMNTRYNIGCELPKLYRQYDGQFGTLSNVDKQEANKEEFGRNFSMSLNRERMTTKHGNNSSIKSKFGNTMDVKNKERLTIIDRIEREFDDAAVDLGFKEGFTIGGHVVDGRSICILILIVFGIVCLCILLIYLFPKFVTKTDMRVDDEYAHY